VLCRGSLAHWLESVRSVRSAAWLPQGSAGDSDLQSVVPNLGIAATDPNAAGSPDGPDRLVIKQYVGLPIDIIQCCVVESAAHLDVLIERSGFAPLA
jgi:hypothetical protein